MRSFAEQLGKTPHGLPQANVTLVRSIAAVYSISVATDDPQIKPVAEICKRLCWYWRASIRLNRLLLQVN